MRSKFPKSMCVCHSVEMPIYFLQDCIWPSSPFYVLFVTEKHNLHAEWPCRRREAFKIFVMAVQIVLGGKWKLCTQLIWGSLTDAVSALSLYPWHSPLYAKGCLLQTFATLRLRALFGINSIFEAGRPKRVSTPRRSSQPKMVKPEVPNGTEFQLFTVVTILLTNHFGFLPSLPHFTIPERVSKE